jgi:sarcosine oxidase, subunit gamma
MTVPTPPVARSPLDGIVLADGLREIPLVAQIDLRADPTDVALLGRLAAAIGVTLPLAPNTVAEAPDGGRRVVWLAPDEWLVIGPAGSEAGLEASLRTVFDGAPGAVVDVSANRTMLALSGSHALDVLASGCAIDLDPRVFGPGRCAQTMLARANVILIPMSVVPDVDIRILVRPSFARYLAAWIEDALGA